jgi:hypothetical protein
MIVDIGHSFQLQACPTLPWIVSNILLALYSSIYRCLARYELYLAAVIHCNLKFKLKSWRPNESFSAVVLLIWTIYCSQTQYIDYYSNKSITGMPTMITGTPSSLSHNAVYSGESYENETANG